MRLHRLLHRIDRTTAQSRVQTEVQTLTELLGPAGLTAQRASFDRRDVLQAWAARLPNGATVAEIEALANRTLTAGEIVPLNAGSTPMRRRGGRRFQTPTGTTYTTQNCSRSNAAPSSTPSDGGMKAARLSIKRPLSTRPGNAQVLPASNQTLSSNSSRRAVASTSSSRRRAGKTTTLGCAAEAWRAIGYRVIGAALAAHAARELEEAAHIPSTTIARRLLALENDRLRFDHDTVLVIDEAGMVGTRTLSALLEHAEQAPGESRPRRRPASTPRNRRRGAPRGPRPRASRTASRQQPPPTRAVGTRRATRLAKRLHGAALDAYTAHNAVYFAHDRRDAWQAIIDDWANASTSGERILMLANRRVDVDRLNTLAHPPTPLAHRSARWPCSQRIGPPLPSRRSRHAAAQRLTAQRVQRSNRRGHLRRP